MFLLRIILATALVLIAAGCAHQPVRTAEVPRAAAVPAPTVSVQRTLRHDGLVRSYRLYVPTALKPARSRPLVLVFHGLGMSASGAEWMTREGFNRLADRAGFLVAYPEGVGRAWNAGARGPVSWLWTNTDDVGYVAALIDALAAEFQLDRRRVYATGFSNGGFLCHRLGLELPGRIAAIAPVAGTLLPATADAGPTDSAMPVCMIHGTADSLVQWGGLAVAQDYMVYHSVENTVAFWARRNGCAPGPSEQTLPDVDPEDGTRVVRATYASPDDAGAVVLYRIENGGHEWPSGKPVTPKAFKQRLSNDLNACQVIWDFFKRHPQPTAKTLGRGPSAAPRSQLSYQLRFSHHTRGDSHEPLLNRRIR